MNFENINKINLKNRESWKNKVFLTFDMDWCADEVLSYTLDLLERYNIKATFFVTHKTTLLTRMRKNQNIELGIHPNFNPLLNGNFQYGKTIDEVVQFYKQIVPESVSVRSHSLTISTPILNVFENHDLKYECNQYIPLNSNIILKPYKHINKVIRIPHFWEDDLHCIYQDSWYLDKYLNYDGLKVFDFHPNNLFLNCAREEHYLSAKPYFSDFEKLKTLINKSTGELDFFNNLLEKVIHAK